MQDYYGIEALYRVLKLQSFEKAAAELRITQSAISQRIKNLEAFHGEPVLLRVLPYKPTALGDKLIRLFAQVQILEQDFTSARAEDSLKPRISIALNRDSLETWFLATLSSSRKCGDVLLEIIADDQELTLDYFRNGVVSACLSTKSEAVKGAEAVSLGAMKYVLTASSQFLKRYNFAKDRRGFFKEAPALKFDRNDNLHERYLRHFFPDVDVDIPYETIPSVAGFKSYAMLGLGYGLVPFIDIVEELKSKALINLFPDRTWDIPLYWHIWSIKSSWYKQFNEEIIAHARQSLKRDYRTNSWK